MSEFESQEQRPQKQRRPRDSELWIQRPIRKFRNMHRLPFRPDHEFFTLADRVVKSDRTLLGYDRLYVFWQVIRNVADVPGSVAEIGSYRGGSAYFIAESFIQWAGSEVPIHVFDTFQGHPEQAITEHDLLHTTGQFNLTSYEDVRSYLARFRLLEVHTGDVSVHLPGLAPDTTYRLVHLDADLYQPTITCLQYFGSRMSLGGVIVLDDYASAKCPGVPQAASEYLEHSDTFRVWDMRSGQLILVKQ